LTIGRKLFRLGALRVKTLNSKVRKGRIAMRNFCGPLLVAFAVMLLTISAADAGKRKCANDWRQFCSQWGLETRGLQNCMRRHGDYLTPACIRGLVKAGAVSQAEVNRRRAQLGR
jgi:hypothetical protein